MAMEISNSLTNLQTARPSKETRGPAHAQPVEKPVKAAEEPVRSEFVKRLEAAEEKRQQQTDRESLTRLVDEVNDQPQVRRRSLQFSVHESTGRVIVKVYDAETEELIREIPPEEVLAVMDRIQDLSPQDTAGIMLQEKA